MEVYRDPRVEKPSPVEVEAGTMSEWEAARFLGCSPRKLWGLRKAGKGPRFLRYGRAIRYPRHLLLAWMDAVAEGGAT